MKRSELPPDYLIAAIARHVRILLQLEHTNNREYNAQRLLKKEIRRLETYKSKKDE